ncbi:MAG: response regulator [Candidatus Electryonea clarkiae]|nr:response regulator [Candidatus Electryonea clarkiae]MDP8286622.1 response regulator [Candidatus Electryonea clarkiae]
MKHKILIADDETDLRDAMEALLSNAGYEVLLAVDGEDCVSKTIEFLPDLILMDVEMPKLNGLEAAQKLKIHHSTADIPILFCTSYGQADIQFAAYSLGADDFIVKPFEIEDLLARLEKHFDETSVATILKNKISEKGIENTETSVIIENISQFFQYLSGLLDGSVNNLQDLLAPPGKENVDSNINSTVDTQLKRIETIVESCMKLSENENINYMNSDELKEVLKAEADRIKDILNS